MKHHTKYYSQHIDEVDYLVINVETTGLSPESGDRVCEIGAVKLRGGAVMETFGSLIDPQRPISAGAYAVNGISPQMLINAPIFSTVAKKLWEIMDDEVLVAYNFKRMMRKWKVMFKYFLSFLYYLLRRFFIPSMSYPQLKMTF